MRRTIPTVALALTGCLVLSTDAVVPSSSATIDPRLIGAWQEVNGTDHAVISRGDSGTYAIEYSSDCKAGRFTARLGTLGHRTVLDMWPTPGDKEIPDPYPGFMIAGHLLLVLDVGSDELRVAALQPDTLGKALQRGIVKLPYVQAKDQLILNGATAELRAALAPYLTRPGALTDPTTFHREKAPASTNASATPNAGGCGARSPAR